MKKSLLNKIVIHGIIIFIIAILASVAVGTIGNVRRTLRLTTNITKSATQIVSHLACHYDINELARTPDSKEYQELQSELQNICNSNGVEYMYIYIPDMENHKLTYVIGVASDERKSKGTLEKSQAGDIIEHQFSNAEKNVWDGKTENLSSVRDNERYGRQMCTYALIEDHNNKRMALVGADYSIDKIYKEIIFETASKVITVFIVLVGVFIAIAFFIKKKIYEPITFLFHNMKNYVVNKTDDNKKFEPIKLDTNDEIQRLADYFNEMVVDIDQYAERIKILASQQVKADTELEVARRIQYGIVGEKRDLCLADQFMLSARMKSARQVGGDFYDSFLLENGNVCVFIGDVSGKGIAAALFMVYVKTLMREKLMDIPNLAQAVYEINREICHSNPEEMFVTSFIAVFDPNSGKFQYVNAGHNKPVIIHDGKAEILACNACMALGVFDDSEYEQCEKKFESGDMLYLYTDGVTEAINSDKEFFGEKNLLNACSTSENTPDRVCRNIRESLERFIGDQKEQFDDVTMIAIKRCDSDLRLSCDLAEVEKIKECIWGLSEDEIIKKKIFLACEEIFSNIVSYSGAEVVQFSCNKNVDKIMVIFEDNGKIFNPLESRQEKSFEDLDEGGMGIMLVKELCSDISYSSIDGKNTLRMEFTGKKS